MPKSSKKHKGLVLPSMSRPISVGDGKESGRTSKFSRAEMEGVVVGADKYHLLSSFVAATWGEAEKVLAEIKKTPVDVKLAEAAALIAIKKFGQQTLLQAPALVNVAGLTLTMLTEHSRLVLSQIRPAANAL